MEQLTQSSQAAAAVAIPETKERTKRKGPKPSSKKCLEKFRLEKSRETIAEIHRQAIERTSVSVDALLKCLSDLQIVAQKQEVVAVEHSSGRTCAERSTCVQVSFIVSEPISIGIFLGINLLWFILCSSLIVIFLFPHQPSFSYP